MVSAHFFKYGEEIMSCFSKMLYLYPSLDGGISAQECLT
jgi:hypothetical protein